MCIRDRWKLQAEEDLAKVEGLNLLVFRMSHVYGPYTSKFLGTALCMARVYQSLNKEMKWLWKEDLRTNTVHVEDVVRALWTGAEWYIKAPRTSPQTFNITDHGNTCKSIAPSILSMNLLNSPRIAKSRFPRSIGLAPTPPAEFGRPSLIIR